jgi:hypothetical protein
MVGDRMKKPLKATPNFHAPGKGLSPAINPPLAGPRHSHPPQDRSADRLDVVAQKPDPFTNASSAFADKFNPNSARKPGTEFALWHSVYARRP